MVAGRARGGRRGADLGAERAVPGVDALSALLALCVAGVSALAALARAWGADDVRAGDAGRFHLFASLFAFTMLVAVTTDNVAVMWVAIEATTITSAVLVPLHRSRASVEASWKYILIGSVGIALAFVGTVLAYFDFVTLAGESAAALHWTVLMAAAPRMHAAGGRAGLRVPARGLRHEGRHRADAHLAARRPRRGARPAVRDDVGGAARGRALRDRALEGGGGHGGARGFADRLLIGLGVLSLGLAALSLVGQRHYKRLLAYSSIEHTGLMCVGLALGPLGTFAAMLHLINHRRPSR